MKISEMTYEEYQKCINSGCSVILPIGSTEQHGYHLPVGTDNIIAEYIAKQICERTNSLLMPTINYGQIWSAKKFPATFSIKHETLKTFIKEIVISLKKDGAKTILLFTGHNGNTETLKQVARDLKDEFGWSDILYSSATFPKSIKKIDAKNTGIQHASALETSMMLYINKDLVKLDKAKEEYPTFPKYYNNRALEWSEFIKVGSFGNPRLADYKTGEELVEGIINNMVEMINFFK